MTKMLLFFLSFFSLTYLAAVPCWRVIPFYISSSEKSGWWLRDGFLLIPTFPTCRAWLFLSCAFWGLCSTIPMQHSRRQLYLIWSGSGYYWPNGLFSCSNIWSFRQQRWLMVVPAPFCCCKNPEKRYSFWVNTQYKSKKRNNTIQNEFINGDE